MQKLRPGLIFLVVILFTLEGFQVHGQDIPELLETGTACDSEESRYMWAQINEYRRQQNLQPLAMNSTLCQIADEQALHIASTSIGNSNLFVREGAGGTTSLNDWLYLVGYGSYDGGTTYVAALSPYVIADLPPTPSDGSVDLVTYMMRQQGNSHLFSNVLSTVYREIGVAYYRTATRHIYVFIFGSQPGVLPIIPIAPYYNPPNAFPYIYAYHWDEAPYVSLLFLNEHYAPSGYVQRQLGTVTHIRQAQNGDEFIECPVPGQELQNGWEIIPDTLINPYILELDGSQGVNTTYFQMCDGLRTSRMNSVTINYSGDAIANFATPVSSPESIDIDQDATATTVAQIAIQETVFAQQTQYAVLATQNVDSQATISAQQTQFSVFSTENTLNLQEAQLAITQTRQHIATQEFVVAQTASVIDATTTEIADIIAFKVADILTIVPSYESALVYPGTMPVRLEIEIDDENLPSQFVFSEEDFPPFLIASLNCLDTSFIGCTEQPVRNFSIQEQPGWNWTVQPVDGISGRQDLTLYLYEADEEGNIVNNAPVWEHPFAINVGRNRLIEIFENNFTAILGLIGTIVAALITAGVIQTRRLSDSKPVPGLLKGKSTFISYKNRETWTYANIVHTRLKQEGVDSYLDRESLRGGDYEEQLFNAISKRDNLIVMLVKNTLESEWVVNEIDFALKAGKNIIPVLIDVKMEDLDIPEKIADLGKQQAVYFSQANLDQAIERIIQYMK